MENEFKIRFPGGYEVTDLFNDNIDINIFLPNGEIYFGTAFTIPNVQYLMGKEGSDYFWATNMFVVKNLARETIRTAVAQSLKDNYFSFIFSQIGTIDKKEYLEGSSFSDILDMTGDRDII